MKLISHRGNIDGKNGYLENHPDYILDAIEKGYDVEIDVWYIDDKFYLGHDVSQYEIDYTFLLKKRLWCHAKNIEALEKLLNLGTKCFFHNTDDVTLTSNGYMWTYPSKKLTSKSIVVLPETYTQELKFDCYGICSDYIKKYK